MKMKYTYLIAFLFGAVAISSCSGSEDASNSAAEGKLVPVTLNLGGIYSNASTRASNNTELADSIPYQLEEGKSLWLFITDNSTNTTTVQGYKVGAQALYTCAQTSTDSLRIGAATNTPLYLTQGKSYTFRAISPAIGLDPTSYKINFKNGMCAVATNDNWTQTEATTVNVPAGTSKEVVTLNPMMEIGARMTFTIMKSDSISDVSFIQSGLEIDGVSESATSVKAANYSVGDNLEPAIGNPYHQLYIAPSQFKEDASGNKIASIGIIPVDCRATTVFVILNVMVNQVPVQYTFAVRNRLFEAGHSYNYKILLSLKGNITVANWQENSWTTTVSPDA
jgi:hypothetical protein